jgi:hypothetical protein
MGYFGLRNYGESDSASDLASEALEKFLKVLKKGIKDKGNEFNTNGITNCALIIEAFFSRNKKIYLNDDFIEFILKLKEMLEKQIEEFKKDDTWSDEDNKKFHIKEHKRMLNSLNKILKDA